MLAANLYQSLYRERSLYMRTEDTKLLVEWALGMMVNYTPVINAYVILNHSDWHAQK